MTGRKQHGFPKVTIDMEFEKIGSEYNYFGGYFQ
jgi:hypothetical protein